MRWCVKILFFIKLQIITVIIVSTPFDLIYYIYSIDMLYFILNTVKTVLFYETNVFIITL